MTENTLEEMPEKKPTPTHVLVIRTHFANMQVPFPDLASALTKADESAASGHCRTPEMTLAFGPGTQLNVIAVEEIAEIERDMRATAATGNLNLPERFAFGDRDHILFIQDAVQPGVLPPLAYPIRKDVENAITFGLKHGYIRYVIKDARDILYITIGPGMLLMPQTAQQYHEQRRARLANQMRQAAQAGPQGGPRIIMPSR